VAWASDILSGGRHLLDMINGLLDLARIEAGRYDLSENTFDLARVVHACVELIRLQAETNQVSIDCALEETIIRADRPAMRQIMLNLLSNAVKFTPAGGVVSIHAERAESGEITVVVADTGIGIDAKTLASIGEPFTQADASNTRKYGGTGLGLSISRRLIGLHDGTLTIESILGEGTTVRVMIPAGRASTEPFHAFMTDHP
jgi:cell cycle sensor histidine kinase DivJ